MQTTWAGQRVALWGLSPEPMVASAWMGLAVKSDGIVRQAA
ncbi:hypothetical protein [Nitratidesulfovibrio oxamicus]|nr:hypothetical protein [Nitratidesulfovibrio oxamicus]